MQCPLARRVFSAVIRLVNAPPAFRIDVVGPDPPPVLPAPAPALRRLGPVLRQPTPPGSPSRPSSFHPSLHGGLTPSHWDPSAPRHGCVNMTWEAKARARHRLESSLSGSPDSDGDGVSPVVDGSGPMRKCRWRSLDPTCFGLSERTHKTGPQQ